jgi:signal transduction histidine kinase/DNA-binding response OmpR family regulator
MKLVRKNKNRQDNGKTDKTSENSPWKVLIVDDETDVHAMTRLSLKDFEFAGKRLQLLEANSSLEAQTILSEQPDIAVALIDVVMETDDAGLKLVDFIRNELKYSLIRLIIRTGQPGMVPENEVIEHYDIDDYKDKTELTVKKLYSTIRLALKSYSNLNRLNTNQNALKKILEIAPEFYQSQYFNSFFKQLLNEIINISNHLANQNHKVIIDTGCIFTVIDNHVSLQSVVGRFEKNDLSIQHQIEQITQMCSEQILRKKSNYILPADALLMPLEIHQKTIGFVYLENISYLKPADRDIIYILAHQGAAALENLQLYLDLKQANEHTLEMLAVADQARKEAEQSRQEAEVANHTKSTFLANISHEFRTPLNSILGYTQLFKQDKNLTKKQHKHIDFIQHSGNYLLKLISDILELSQIERGHIKLYPSDFHFTAFIQDLVKLFQIHAQQKGIAFVYKPLSYLPTFICADEKRLRQILINLLSNAIKFTERGGITFRIKSERFNEPTPDSDSTSSFLRFHFEVEDTGIGIGAENIDKIFLPFEQAMEYQDKPEGTGLGLSITQELIEIMGGELHVESKVGEGSRFWGNLLFPEALEWEPPKSSIIVGYEGARRKILVIDDHEENRFVLADILKPLGFEVCEAEEGEEGLKKMREFKPDLIITDLVMPVMDGFEFIRKVRALKEFQQLPILAESASVLDSENTNFCDAFIAKPVSIEELLELLQNHLDLVWIEKEMSLIETEDNKGNDEEIEGSAIKYPSLADLTKLFELSELGDISGIIEQVKQLEKNDIELSPFVQKIRHFTKSYDTDGITELLKPCIVKNETPQVELSTEHAFIFFDLGLRGDVMAIIEQVKELKRTGNGLNPLLNEIEELAKNYRCDEVCELVKGYLDAETDMKT